MAPAFGMAGTLIGLIKMLKNLNLSDSGSSSLGESMSVPLSRCSAPSWFISNAAEMLCALSSSAA